MASMTAALSAVLTRRVFADLPATAVHEAKRLVLDYVGVTLAGARSEPGTLAGRFALAQGGPAQARVLGHREPVSAVNAAFANAIAAHSLEFDDIDGQALFHSSAPVVSAALAVAEMEHAGGRELLTAVLAGCETLARISAATNPELLKRGFHTTAAAGAFGAAAAAGVVLGASQAELVNALGLAGAQASGIMEIYGASMVKRFNPGPAARNGVTAALMARSGFTAEETVLEGERGFGAAFAGVFRAEAFLDGLGTAIPVQFEFKRYGSCRPIHAAIDAALQLRSAHGLRPDDIVAVTVYRHPLWETMFTATRPRSAYEARVSLPYSLGLALATGTALPGQYAAVGQGDEAAMALSGRVRILADPTLRRTVASRVAITTTNGETLTAEVEYPSGSERSPIGDEELTRKFHSSVDGPLGAERAARLAGQLWRLDELSDVTELTRLPAEAQPALTEGAR
ncbi:MAG TPA: MmgE/PrpD family protein [Trebonia sp.]